jgi:hypothetical protein
MGLGPNAYFYYAVITWAEGRNILNSKFRNYNEIVNIPIKMKNNFGKHDVTAQNCHWFAEQKTENSLDVLTRSI